VTALQALLDDDHLAVLDDPEDALVAEPAALAFDAMQREQLRRQLVDDHRIDADIARRLSAALVVAPAPGPWPEPRGVVALAESVAARFALERNVALCLAVAVSRRVGRHGYAPLALGD
jgi:hypothetical protein